MMLAIRLLACALLAPLAFAQAWPEYRGPARDGRADAARVPLEWSEKKNLRWKTPIPGLGWSSPVVWNDRIWLTTATEDGRRMFVLAVDFATGEKLVGRMLFENDEPAKKNALNSYASPSPTLEADRVYVHFGTYGTACLHATTGETVWQRRDINCDHMEGPGSSPVLFEDLLIFHVDGGDVQFVIALDKETGATKWQRERSIDFADVPNDLRKAYSTPIFVEVEGAIRMISSGAKATMAYDPRTGEELWRVRHDGFSMSSRPLHQDGVLFLNTGFMRAELLAVRADGEGDVTDDNIVWRYARNVPRMPSPLLIDGRLYMVSDNGIASCLDAKTGERVWQERIGSEHCASPVFAAGRIYFFDREGRSVVIAPGDKFESLAENQLDDGFMASPAIVGDAFVLRTRSHLYRIEERRAEKVKGEDGR